MKDNQVLRFLPALTETISLSYITHASNYIPVNQYVLSTKLSLALFSSWFISILITNVLSFIIKYLPPLYFQARVSDYALKHLQLLITYKKFCKQHHNFSQCDNPTNRLHFHAKRQSCNLVKFKAA